MIFPLFFPKLVSDENFLSTSKLTPCFLEKRPSQLFSCVCIPAFPPQELPPWGLQTPFTPTIVLHLTESLILYFRLVVFPVFLLFVSCFSFICSSLSYWHWLGCCSWASSPRGPSLRDSLLSCISTHFIHLSTQRNHPCTRLLQPQSCASDYLPENPQAYSLCASCTLDQMPQKTLAVDDSACFLVERRQFFFLYAPIVSVIPFSECERT